MAELQLPNYLGIVNQGREIGERRGLAQLYGQAMGASREQRPSLLAKMAGTDPQTAMAAQKHFDANDETARERLGQYAAAFDALPDEQKPMAYPKLAQQAQELGIPAPPEWNPEFAPHIQKLAQTLRGGGGYQVQSTKVGADGFIYTIGRDGSFQNTGIKADPNTQIMEAAGGIYGIDKRNMQAAPVQIGQPGMQQPQQARAPGEVPFTIDPSLPPEVQAAIRANESQFASAPDGANIPIANRAGQMPMGGGQLQGKPQEINPLEVARLQFAQQQAAQPSEFERKLQIAQAMGATPEQLKQMVLGDSGGGKPTATQMRQANTAKAKLIDLNAIRAQLARVKQSFGPLQGTISATPYVGKLIPSEEGKRFDATVSMLQGMVRKLTRTPGEGAMSDYETKLAQLANPSRSEYESVTADQIAQLEELVQTMTQGYEALLQDNGGNSANIQQGQQMDAPRTNRVNSQPAQQFGGFRILED